MNKRSSFVSKEVIAIDLNKREIIGKGLNKLKAEGLIPAVIHQPGKDSLIVSGNFIELSKVYEKAGRHHPVNVTIGTEKKLLTIIKDVDIDPAKHRIRHIVFGAINLNEKVYTVIPVKLTGEAPAARANLLVHQLIEEVEVAALPNDLPDSINVSIESLAEVDDRITIGDITPPKGVEIEVEKDQVIVIVDAPHVASEESEEAAAEEASAPVATTEASSENN
jgi:large subunit ribosomal protein L25